MVELTNENKKRINQLIEDNNMCNLAIYLSSISENRNSEELEKTVNATRDQFWQSLNEGQQKEFNNVMASANLLYYDFSTAFDHYTQAENMAGIIQLRDHATLYGKADAILKIINYARLNNIFELGMSNREFRQFLVDKTITHIGLQREGDDFFVDDSCSQILQEIGKEPCFDIERILKRQINRMNTCGNDDSPRKLLLSLYSNDSEVIAREKKEFNSKKGKRENIDLVVGQLCEENKWSVVKKLQTGDNDSFYPLSANLYIVESPDGERFVLKENIRYKIDFSRFDGYNMELELYSLGLNDKLFPGFYGISEKEDIKFLKLEYIEGYELTEHTQLNNLFSVEKIIDILMHLASTLSYLHDRDIIYADMKDKNVICENECEKVRLLDLGMASNKIRVEKETGEKFVYEIVSNAEYACPETITSSKVYKKSDVFQLGILAYKLVTGEHPFAEGIATQDYLEKGAELIAFSLANLWNNANLDNFFFEDTPELGNLVSDMLKKDYSQRPDSISVVSRLQTIKEKYYGGKTK